MKQEMCQHARMLSVLIVLLLWFVVIKKELNLKDI